LLVWEVFLCHRGQRKRKAFGKEKEDLENAIRFAGDLKAELKKREKVIQDETSATSLEPGEKRVMDVADDWLRLNKVRRTGTTEERYFGIVRDYVSPAIGKLPINKVDRLTVKELLVKVGEMKAHKTVELIHCVLSSIFSEAIEMGLIEKNPAEGLLKKILPPKRKRAEKRPDPFPQADRDWFLEVASQTMPAPYPLLLKTLVLSGMRLGEGLAMKVDGLDAVNSMYRVDQSVRRAKYSLPKTGERVIDLPKALTEELVSYIRQLRLKAMQIRTPVNYLFPAITQGQVRDVMKRVCLRAGLRLRTPHELRHTYATLLLMAHVSPAYVQKQLGHHSITMTVDTYCNWIPGEGKGDLEKVCGVQSEAGRHMAVV
jgi:integrase